MFTTFGVGSARIRVANVFSVDGAGFPNHRSRLAGRKWIASETRLTDADWNVIGDPTFGVGTAGVSARILATIADASAITWAVSVQDTFRTT